MNMLKLAGGLGAILVLTACPVTDKECDTADSADCVSDDTGATDDTGSGTCDTYAGATYLGVDNTLCASPGSVEPVIWDCDSADWWFDVYTVGWTNGADALVYQTGSANGWDENHPIASYAFDDDGYWDNLYAELGIVTTTGEVIDGQTTLYQCDTARADSLTVQLVIYDTDNVEVDCAVWGDDPSFPSGSCTDISSWF